MFDINSIAPQPISPPAKAAEPVLKNSDVQTVPVKVAAVDKKDAGLSEDDRQARVATAARSFFKDTFVVSDTSFSIFKDSTGQYITRFTNLRDGSVTYIPEVEILQYQGSSSSSESLVEIQA